MGFHDKKQTPLDRLINRANLPIRPLSEVDRRIVERRARNRKLVGDLRDLKKERDFLSAQVDGLETQKQTAKTSDQFKGYERDISKDRARLAELNREIDLGTNAVDLAKIESKRRFHSSEDQVLRVEFLSDLASFDFPKRADETGPIVHPTSSFEPFFPGGQDEYRRSIRNLKDTLDDDEISLGTDITNIKELLESSKTLTGADRLGLKTELASKEALYEKVFAGSMNLTRRLNDTSDAYIPKGPGEFYRDLNQQRVNEWNRLSEATKAKRGISVGFDQFIASAEGAGMWAGIPGAEQRRDFWLDGIENYMPPDDARRFTDTLYQGIGSLIPTLPLTFATGGAAAALNIGRAAPWVAAGSQSAVISMIEAGDTYATNKELGLTDEAASASATKSFWINLPIGIVLDRFGEFNPNLGKTLNRFMVNAPLESIEEMQQGITQNILTGRPWDEGILEAGAVGGILSAGTTAAGLTIQQTEKIGLPTRKDGELTVDVKPSDNSSLSKLLERELEVELPFEESTLSEVAEELEQELNPDEADVPVWVRRDVNGQISEVIKQPAFLSEDLNLKRIRPVATEIQWILNDAGGMTLQDLKTTLRSRDVFATDELIQEALGVLNTKTEEGVITAPFDDTNARPKLWNKYHDTPKLESVLDVLANRTQENGKITVQLRELKKDLQDQGWKMVDENWLQQFAEIDPNGTTTVDVNKLVTEYAFRTVKDGFGDNYTQMVREIVSRVTRNGTQQASLAEIKTAIAEEVAGASLILDPSYSLDIVEAAQRFMSDPEFKDQLGLYTKGGRVAQRLSDRYSDVLNPDPDQTLLNDEIENFRANPGMVNATRIVSAGLKTGFRSFKTFWNHLMAKLGDAADVWALKHKPEIQALFEESRNRINISQQGGFDNRFIQQQGEVILERLEETLDIAIKDGKLSKEAKDLRLKWIKDRFDNFGDIAPIQVLNDDPSLYNDDVSQHVSEIFHTILEFYPELRAVVNEVILEEGDGKNAASFDQISGTLYIGKEAFGDQGRLVNAIGHEMAHAMGFRGGDPDQDGYLNYFMFNGGERAARIFGAGFWSTFYDENGDPKEIFRQMSMDPAHMRRVQDSLFIERASQENFKQLLDAEWIINNEKLRPKTRLPFTKGRLPSQWQKIIDGTQFVLMDQLAAARTLEDELIAKHGDLPFNLRPESNIQLGQRSNEVARSIIEDGLVDEFGKRATDENGQEIPSLADLAAAIEKNIGYKEWTEAWQAMDKKLKSKELSQADIEEYLIDELGWNEDHTGRFIEIKEQLEMLIRAVKNEYAPGIGNTPIDEVMESVMADPTLDLFFKDSKVDPIVTASKFIDLAVRNSFATDAYRALIINQIREAQDNDLSLLDFMKDYFEIVGTSRRGSASLLRLAANMSREETSLDTTVRSQVKKLKDAENELGRVAERIAKIDKPRRAVSKKKSKALEKEKAALQDRIPGLRAKVEDAKNKIGIHQPKLEAERDFQAGKFIWNIETDPTNAVFVEQDKDPDSRKRWVEKDIYVDGNRYKVRMDPFLFRAMETVKPTHRLGIVRVLNWFNRKLKGGITGSPLYAPVGLAKDIVGATANQGFNPLGALQRQFPSVNFVLPGQTAKDIKTALKLDLKSADTTAEQIKAIFSPRTRISYDGRTVTMKELDKAFSQSGGRHAENRLRDLKPDEFYYNPTFLKTIGQTVIGTTLENTSPGNAVVQDISKLIADIKNGKIGKGFNALARYWEAPGKHTENWVRLNMFAQVVEQKLADFDAKTVEEQDQILSKASSAVRLEVILAFRDRAPLTSFSLDSREDMKKNYVELVKKEAAIISVDLMNYTKSGLAAREANAIIPYLNAPFQGYDAVRKGMKKSPGKWISRGVLAYILPKLLEGIRWADDEDYQNLPDYVKDNYLIVWKLGDGTFVKVPVEEQFAALWLGPTRKLLDSGADTELNDIVDMLTEGGIEFFINESTPIDFDQKFRTEEEDPNFLEQREFGIPSLPLFSPLAGLAIAESSGVEINTTWYTRIYETKESEGAFINWLNEKGDIMGDQQSPEFTKFLVESFAGQYTLDAVRLSVEGLRHVAGEDAELNFWDVAARRFLQKSRRIQGTGTELGGSDTNPFNIETDPNVVPEISIGGGLHF